MPAPARSRCASAGQSGAMITSCDVAVPRVLDRRGGDAGLDRAGEVDRRVVDQHVDPDLHAAGDLVVGAVELVVREPDAGPATRSVCGCASVARWLVMWMKWPCSCQLRIVSTAPGIGLGGEHVLGPVGLVDAGLQLLGPQAVDRPGVLASRTGSSTPKRRWAISASWSQYGCSVESMSIARRTAAGTVAACRGSSGRFGRSPPTRCSAAAPTRTTPTATTRPGRRSTGRR